MRIAVFSRSTFHHFISGGMESQLRILLSGLSAFGHDITVFTTSLPTDDVQHKIEKSNVVKTDEGIKYVFVGDTTSGLNPLSPWEKFFVSIGILNRQGLVEGKKNYYDASTKEFLKAHIENSFDCVLSQSTAAKGLLEHAGIKVPIISIIHGTIPSEIKSRFRAINSIKNWIRFVIVDLPKWTIEHYTTNREFFKRCQYIIAVSNDLRIKFLKDYPYLKHRVRVIYNGVVVLFTFY